MRDTGCGVQGTGYGVRGAGVLGTRYSVLVLRTWYFVPLSRRFGAEVVGEAGDEGCGFVGCGVELVELVLVDVANV